MRVAIVGGGWAGLSAAVELSKAGSPGHRLRGGETARWPGAQRRYPGTPAGQWPAHPGRRLSRNTAPDEGSRRRPDRLLRRLPLEICFPDGQPAPFRLRLPRLPAPWHLAVGLLASRGASLAEKLSAAFVSCAFLQNTGYRLNEDCTVATLLDRHGQHGTLRRYLWQPLCLAALNTAPEEASAQIFVPIRCATAWAVIARRPTCCCRRPTSTGCSRQQRRTSSAHVAVKSACRPRARH
jgi:hypothetical protein